MDRVGNYRAKIGTKSHRSLLAGVLYGMGFTVLFSLAFLLILALVAYRNSDPTKLLIPFSYTALVISSLLCGYSGAKFRGASGVLSGACSGIMFVCVIFFASQCFGGGNPLPLPLILCVYGCMILLSALGGFMAGKKKGKRRKHRF